MGVFPKREAVGTVSLVLQTQKIQKNTDFNGTTRNMHKVC